MLWHGPQPREGFIAVLLEEFPAYTLETLKRADVTELLEVLEYRKAVHAVALFNQGKEGRARLAERPDMMSLLLEMARAQMGSGVTMDDVWAGLKAARPDEEEDE